MQCTGVAEPKGVIDTFKDAEEEGDPLMTKETNPTTITKGTLPGLPIFSESIMQVRFDNVITVVDSATFVKNFMSKQILEVLQHYRHLCHNRTERLIHRTDPTSQMAQGVAKTGMWWTCL